MIKELFLPRTIKGKLVFPEHIIGISIDHLSVDVALLYVKRNLLTVQSLEKHKINSGDPKTYTQRLTAALKRLAPQIKPHMHVRVGFPASKVIIKELTVPFLDSEKIKMVVEYEIEPSIPFDLENALIDFVIIEQSEVKQSSKLLVAAAQLEEVKKFVDTFKKAGIEPHEVTIDLFGLAALYRMIPDYEQLKHECAIIDIGSESTRIGLMHQQTLFATRTIQKGSVDLEAAAENAFIADLFEEIQFTLNSFNLKREELIKLEKVLFLGPKSLTIPLQEKFKEASGIVGEQFATDKLANNKQVKSNLVLRPDSWHTYTRAIGIALLDEQYADFSLRQKSVALSSKPLIKKQFITAITLASILLFSLLFLGYLNISNLNTRIKIAEKQEMQKIRTIFPPEMKKRGNLKQMVKDAEQYVSEQEEIWAPFANQRLRPLVILQELTTIFNKKKFDVTVTEVLITSEEQEQNPIEIHGFFRSQTGSDHFKHFGELEKDIRNAKTLILTEEIDPTPAEDGVQFIVRFKQREL